MKITTVGVDLAKTIMQIHGVDERGRVVIRKQLKRGRVLAYFANLLYNYLESYYIVFRSIKYLQKKPRSEKEFLKRINSIGNKSYKLGEVERSEALSESNFQNALKIFGEKGIVTKKRPEGKGATTFSPPSDEDAKDFYGRQLAKFLRR